MYVPWGYLVLDHQSVTVDCGLPSNTLVQVACLPLQGSGKGASPRASPHGSPTPHHTPSVSPTPYHTPSHHTPSVSPTPHHTPSVSSDSPTQEDLKLVSESFRTLGVDQVLNGLMACVQLSVYLSPWSERRVLTYSIHQCSGNS